MINLRGIGEKVLDLIYPQSIYCNCCGNIIDESRMYGLCDYCITHIRWDNGDISEKDGLKVLRCTQYGIFERTLIFSLKYNKKTYIARDLAKIMADRLNIASVDFDVIVPVPMYRAKERKRGFNQAALIGAFLGKELNKRQIADALIRTKDTKPMRSLNPIEREINVRDNFALNSNYAKILENRNLLLVDDFYTTGSTARECYNVLLKASPKCVYFISFAAK